MVPPSSHRVPRVRQYSGSSCRTSSFTYMTITFFDQASHPVRLLSVLTFTVLNPKGISTSGLSSYAFARHYLRNHFCFLFLRVMRCFSSPGLPHAPHGTGIAAGGFPHSEIRASTGICPYARLIAAYHVLRRLQEPRHPSCALFSFPCFFHSLTLF